MSLPRFPRVCVLVAVMLAAAVAAQAGVIQSPGGGFLVGINDSGQLVDWGTLIGFQRVGDNYDPIMPGTPREAWGVSAGAVGGYADPWDYGVANLAPNGPPVFNVSSAAISSFLMDPAGGQLLRVDQQYGFAAENVLMITETVTNVSGSPQAVLFSRHVDWDIAPTEYDEIIQFPAVFSPIVDASYDGFEDPDPLASFWASAPGGGVFGPEDYGAAMLLDLATLADGESVSFNIYHAISDFGQSEADLRAQLTGLGVAFIMTGMDDAGGTNSAALGYGPASQQFVIPEPATLALLGLGSLVLARRRRRSARRAS